MEPVFMVLGQSAASAACLAMQTGIAVQQLPYEQLRKQLLADQQVLNWTGPSPRPAAGRDPGQLEGLVFDDESMDRTGEWLPSRSVSGFVGTAYWHDANEAQGSKSARFRIRVKNSGRYDVRLAYTAHANRATNVRVLVQHADGEAEVRMNQQTPPAIDKMFASLGKFRFESDREYSIRIETAGANGYVVVDAVQLIPD